MITRLMTWVVLLFTSSPVFAATGEAREWLDKMSSALRDQDYQGIFTYIRGSTFDTVRIVHQVRDGKEIERLYNMNGEVRELLRQDGEVVCLHPSDAEGEITDHSVQIGPFSPAFSEKVMASQHLYRVEMVGNDRIAGRSAVVLAVSPRHLDRYGYKIWLDEETGLMLQSHLVERGRVREIFQFTSLTIGPVTDDQLASAIVGETFAHPLSLEVNDRVEKPVWRVSWLPNGFRPVRVQGNRLHFTDGLATFSVFVESPDAASLPEMTTTVGGTVVLTRRFDKSGPQITVVGEVPVRTAQRVAESVEPVLY